MAFQQPGFAHFCQQTAVTKARQKVVSGLMALVAFVTLAFNGHGGQMGEVVDQGLVVRRHVADVRVVHAEHAEQGLVTAGEQRGRPSRADAILPA